MRLFILFAQVFFVQVSDVVAALLISQSVLSFS
jgi:hypothetical protein